MRRRGAQRGRGMQDGELGGTPKKTLDGFKGALRLALLDGDERGIGDRGRVWDGRDGFEPGVNEDEIKAGTGDGVRVEHAVDQILGLDAEVVRHGVVALDHLLEHLAVARSRERVSTDEHDVQHDTKDPDIDLMGGVELALGDFGSDVLRVATKDAKLTVVGICHGGDSGR